MAKEEIDPLGEEDINFIYVHTNTKEDEEKMRVLGILEEKYGAKVTFTDLVDDTHLTMSGEALTEEELKTLGDNRPREMSH